MTMKKWGMLTDGDALVLGDAAKTVEPRTCVEIGTWSGETAQWLSTFGLDVYTIGPVVTQITTWPTHYLRGKSREIAAIIRRDRWIGLLWIDGCHCSDCVYEDLCNYAPLVCAGGLIALHDIGNEGGSLGDLSEHPTRTYGVLAGIHRYGMVGWREVRRGANIVVYGRVEEP